MILNISPSTLRNLFHKHHGLSPRDYVIRKKMNKVKFLLCSTDMNITDICSFVGYDNFSKMSAMFKKMYGMTPSQYRQKESLC